MTSMFLCGDILRICTYCLPNTAVAGAASVAAKLV